MLNIRLAQFEGPLDLLLHLIQKAELDIADIFVSDITQQYMAVMEQAAQLDMDAASEFLQVAAQLLYIKSRSLLPRRQAQEEGEEEDPEQQFIRQLHEYKACKEASELLHVLAAQAEGIFTRLPEEYLLPPPKVEMKEVPIERLYEAFAGLMTRQMAAPAPPPLREVYQDRYQVSDRADHIRHVLRQGSCCFHALFPVDGGRMGIIVTFMALLELLARQEALVSQQGIYGEIMVERGHGRAS